MTGLFFLCAVLTAPAIEVSIAPDQPVPYVYADDPVILQVKSSEDGKASGQVTIVSDSGTTVVVPLVDLPLRASGPHWMPLDSAPTSKGRYRAQVSLDAGGGAVSSELVFCRIERPNGEIASPVRVAVGSSDPGLLHAMRGIPFQRVTVGASTQNEHALTNGFKLTIAADVKTVNDAAVVGSLIDSAKDRIEGWRISLPDGGMPEADPAINVLRQSSGRTNIEMLLTPSANVPELLAGGLGRAASTLVVRATDYDASDRLLLRSVTERAGYESYPLTVGYALESDDADVSSMRQLLGGLGGGIITEIDGEALYANGAFSDAYPMVSALVHRINGQTFSNDYGSPGSVRGKTFRNDDQWTLVLWTNNVASDHTILLGEATELAAFDAWNNPVPAPPLISQAMRVTVSKTPMYITGKGGALLSHNARNAARAEADLFLKDRWLQQDLSKEFSDVLRPIAESGFRRTDRVTFFALLRMFPVLEQKWHDGTMRRDVAVPAMAALARLVRNLCVLEQESGEPFIELLQETTARCAEYQSQYLTSTGGSNVKHERADWLLAEVARLTAEAKSLADAGLGIEAVGVASIAEWRARSLEFAQNAAPLGTPEPPRVAPAPAKAPAKKKR
ncbi:MAG TPA: hypothetical protein PLJ47_10655 [Candidatus Hydrogenedentes bacterium]|nr:hypothetical protein [Candidatus Hydrogenedentota bacterium]